MQLGPDAISGFKDKDKRTVKVGDRVKDPTVTFLARMVEVGGYVCLQSSTRISEEKVNTKSLLGGL